MTYPAPAAAAGSAPSRERPWLRWGRWLMLSMCLLGAAGAWDRDRWAETPAHGPVAGLLGALACVCLCVYGFVAWVVTRWLFPPPRLTYLRAARSPLVLSFLLLGMPCLPSAPARTRPHRRAARFRA